MERKAHIEFVNSTTLRVTTPYRQKEFKITDTVMRKEIDLIGLTLRNKDEEPSPFYAVVGGGGTINAPYYVIVNARTNAGWRVDEIGSLEWPKNKATFKVTLP